MPQLDMILVPINFRCFIVVFLCLYFLVSFCILPLILQLFFYRNALYGSMAARSFYAFLAFHPYLCLGFSNCFSFFQHFNSNAYRMTRSHSVPYSACFLTTSYLAFLVGSLKDVVHKDKYK